jgi:hypothetical protein
LLKLFYVLEAAHHAFNHFNELNLRLLAKLFHRSAEKGQQLLSIVFDLIEIGILDELKVGNKAV